MTIFILNFFSEGVLVLHEVVSRDLTSAVIFLLQELSERCFVSFLNFLLLEDGGYILL